MGIIIGEVPTFENARTGKEQAVKLLEEAAEAFGAWQAWYDMRDTDGDELAPYVVDECCDVIQATCNLLAAMGVGDLAPHLADCRRRNEERGRKYGR